jgi:hypothetical protein
MNRCFHRGTFAAENIEDFTRRMDLAVDVGFVGVRRRVASVDDV